MKNPSNQTVIFNVAATPQDNKTERNGKGFSDIMSKMYEEIEKYSALKTS